MVLLMPIQIPASVLNAVVSFSPLLITILSSIMQLSDYVFSSSFFKATKMFQTESDIFDFIVVGAGSAGAAVAARLSEDSSMKVLLLEQGGDPSLLSYIPAATPSLMSSPSDQWGYKTTQQKRSALGILNQQVVWPRGKSLGGSSNLNFMIYMRGNPKDFDRWAELSANDRWKYENVEKYFQRIEDYMGNWFDKTSGAEIHGYGGPLRVEGVRYHPGVQYVLDAAKEIGYEVGDLNGNLTHGFSPLDFTQKRGMRFSTYRAYILPSLLRLNLEVYRYTLATQIHFDKFRRAVGVSYQRHGVKGYATAKKEIIICGGAINSPQLLMLSGIGPKRHLWEMGIPSLVDLPVGYNLQDHVTTFGGPFILNQSESFMLHRDVNVGSVIDFVKQGVGPLASPLALTSIGLISTPDSEKDWPNIIYTVLALGIFEGLPQLLDQTFVTSENLAQQYLFPDIGKDNHVVLVSLGRPRSRGYVRLQNSDPTSQPIINPRYYSDPDDQDVKDMIKGIQLIVRMFENTTSLQKLDAHLPPRNLPGCERYPLRSDAYYECVLRTATITLFHPAGTCSMGRPNDLSSVVDSELRVIGVKGLRVADASIMPFVTNANTNAPSIMIGEMCADMIKEKWKVS